MHKQLSKDRATVRAFFPVEGEAREVVAALLSDSCFYAFEESPEGLNAYAWQDEWNEDWRPPISEMFPGIDVSTEVIGARDWNEEWEKSFEGIRVEDFVEVLPPFRAPEGGTEHVIVIEPKMAFGTGHHHTTQLMMLQCRGTEFSGKRVLDMGTGTGVLGILAEKLGAAAVTGIDIDEWSGDNAPLNAALNGCTRFTMITGDVHSIPEVKFDIIFANINRNILLEDGAAYVAALAEGGRLFVSGFFDFDTEKVRAHFTGLGLTEISAIVREGWVSLGFEKGRSA